MLRIPRKVRGFVSSCGYRNCTTDFLLLAKNYVTWKRDRTDVVDLEWEEPEGMW